MTEQPATFVPVPNDFKSDVKPVWCPGCGDFGVLNAMAKAMARLALRPENVAVVSGIGCSSRIPAYTSCYGFHGVHGRALPTATGLKIARPDLTVRRFPLSLEEVFVEWHRQQIGFTKHDEFFSEFLQCQVCAFSRAFAGLYIVHRLKYLPQSGRDPGAGVYHALHRLTDTQSGILDNHGNNRKTRIARSYRTRRTRHAGAG